MTLACALHYAERGKPVFPVLGKRPLIPWGAGASSDPAQITAWWTRWPNAAIGVPTGSRSGLIVLDIDVKQRGANGYDTLDDLGLSILPETPMAHTPSGGLHVYFATIAQEIRNSAGEDGLGRGLDVRGQGGFIVAPSPGSGYAWDPHCNPDTVALMPVPPWLGHRRQKQQKSFGRGRFNPPAILDTACENIRRAGPGERHCVLNREVFTIAAMVRAGALKEHDARHQLEAAAAAMSWASKGDRTKAARDFADAWRDGFAKGGTA